MENTYQVSLVNAQGCNFDNASFTNLETAKKWAAGRTGFYTVIITKNYDADTDIAEDVIEYEIDETRKAAASLGRKGGSVKSEAKAKASAENGKKGGRPRKVVE